MQLNFLTVSENGYFISLYNLSMDDEEGCKEVSQLETGFVPLEGNVLGTGPHIDGRYGRKMPNQAQSVFVQGVISSGMGLKESPENQCGSAHL